MSATIKQDFHNLPILKINTLWDTINRLIAALEKNAQEWYKNAGNIGKEYRGTKTTTVSGIPCQKWTAQIPHKHTRTPARYPGSGLGDHSYCRNPDNDPGGAWCYTTDPAKRWEYCGIPRCGE